MGWYEGPVDSLVASLLMDLRDAVWAMRRERMELKAALADAVVKMELQKKEITALKEGNFVVDAANRARSQKCGMMKLWAVGVVVCLAAAGGLMRLGYAGNM